MKEVVIYTDGACSGNPGPGGWAAILNYKGFEKEIFGFEDKTTNNRMELLSVIKGLEGLKEKCDVTIYSDSAYVVNAFNNDWIKDWKKTNYNNGKIKNIDLWDKLIKLTNYHQVNFIKVKGHSDNVNNNKCDELARMAIINSLKLQNQDKN